jgi:transposase
MSKPAAVTSWVRWLAHCGVPPDHIARVLDCPAGDVAELLKARAHARTIYHADHPLRAEIHRLRGAGLSWRAIGNRVGLSFTMARHIIRYKPRWQRAAPRPPRPRDANRPRVGGLTATRFRRLLELGYEPGRVAELLQVHPAAVDDLVERLRRRQGQGELRRARTHREQAALCEWDRFLGDPEPEPLPAMPDDAQGVDPVKPAIAPATPTPRGDWGSIHATEAHYRALSDDDLRRFWTLHAAGLWRRELAETFNVSMATVGRILRAGPPAGVGPIPARRYRKLDVAGVRRFWELRANGLTRRELAKTFGVSEDTVSRIIKAGPPTGETPAVEVLDAPPPAMPAESGPQPHRWSEPRGERGNAWNDD